MRYCLEASRLRLDRLRMRSFSIFGLSALEAFDPFCFGISFESHRLKYGVFRKKSRFGNATLYLSSAGGREIKSIMLIGFSLKSALETGGLV